MVAFVCSGTLMTLFGALLWFVYCSSLETSKIALGNDIQAVENNVRLRLDGNRDYLQLLAEDLAGGGFINELFQERVSLYVADHPELININWTGPDNVIRTVAPIEGNRQIVGLTLSLPEPKRAAAKARATGRPVYTRPFEAIQGDISFEIWVPIFRHQEFLGLVSGIYSCNRLLEHVAPETVLQRNHLMLVDPTGAVIGEMPARETVDGRFAKSVQLSPLGNGVGLVVERYGSRTGNRGLVLLGVVAIALSLGTGFWMWLLSRELRRRRRAEDAMIPFSWLLEKEQGIKSQSVAPAYEDVTALNEDGLILNAVGADTLKQMAANVMDLLDTSLAVYEKNGDYAMGTFVSGWCGTLNNASRALCETDDNRKALDCGKWLCHEKCWETSKAAIDSGEPVDEVCCGEIRMYAVPIISGNQTIGVVSIGYGTPPQTAAKQKALAEAYHLDLKTIQHNAESYKPRPSFIINVAKRRLQSIARLIGEIVEHKQAEKLLRESAARFRHLFENAPLGYQSLNEAGDLIEINETWCALLGYTKEEVLGKNFGEFVHPDSPLKFADNFPKFKRQGTVTDSVFEMIRKDGSVVTISFDGKIAHQPDGSFKQTHCVLRDVTKQKDLEDQLRQAQKMESVGQLTGGIAHDFNNKLQVILGHAEMALPNVPPEDRLHRDLIEIQKAALHSADLTRQLLTFARKETITPSILNLNTVTENLLNMLRRLIGENIRLVWSPQTDLWAIYMDPSQIDQILTNLCVNARDAIAEVGEINITTTNQIIDGSDRRETNPPGDYVQLSLSDTGCGMDRETLAKIFEPFFTTKGLGEGTGLGLSTLYGIAQQNKGFITVDSTLDKGTTFKIHLPRCADKETAGKVAETKPPERGQETVLLVEDEAVLLDIGQQMLEGLGYTVLSAQLPEEALRIAKKTTEPIDLLLTDVIMPCMNGHDLAIKLKELIPDLKCLFMSGYPDGMIAHDNVMPKGTQFIQKPFSTLDIAAKVRQVLKS